MIYGSTYQRYGAGICPLCKEPHAGFLHIRETQRSRFKIMQFNAEMMSKGSSPLMIDVGRSQKFMVGILLSGPFVLVAASGGNLRKIAETAKLKNYILCPAIDEQTSGHVTRVRRPISKEEYASTRCITAGTPGQCAAPRLIEHAFTIPAVASNWRNWEMSEVFYQPNTTKRTEDNLHWVHGLSAHHCGTCEKLIPLLMCPRPAAEQIDDNQK